MLRFVRVYGVSSNESRVLYRVSKPRFISAYKYFNENFSSAFSAPSDKLPLVFNTSIAFNVPASTDSTSSASTVTGGPGEMTSEPIDGPGEML